MFVGDVNNRILAGDRAEALIGEGQRARIDVDELDAVTDTVFLGQRAAATNELDLNVYGAKTLTLCKTKLPFQMPFFSTN